MAQDRINSSSEAFEAAVNKFKTCMESAQDAYNAMNSAVFMLDSSWNGEASAAFVNKFQALAKNLTTSDGTITKAVADIQMVVAGHAQMEDETSQLFAATADTTDPFAAG